MVMMRNKKWTPNFIVLAIVCFQVGVGIGLIGHHYFLKPQPAVYEGLSDSSETKSEKPFAVKIKVEKEGSTYKILEKQYDELCKCMCKRKVEGGAGKIIELE